MSAAPAAGATGTAIRRPGQIPIEKRLKLWPAAYAAPPEDFGRSRSAVFAVPTGGDWPSRRAAELQHGIVQAWRSAPHRLSLEVLARRYGVSKQSLSLVARGQRWMGSLCGAAFVDGARRLK